MLKMNDPGNTNSAAGYPLLPAVVIVTFCDILRRFGWLKHHDRREETVILVGEADGME